MNLTITVDDEIVRRARVRALQQGTSINQVLREFLESYVGSEVEREARARLVGLARGSAVSSGTDGRTWTRESLYGERLDRHGPRGVHEAE